MAEHTNISWTHATWSPFQGCSRKSAGCEHCYSERMVATRLSRNPATPQFHGLTNEKGRWTGEMRLHEPTLFKPLHWRKPRMIFVNSLSDTFHENVPDEWLDRIFAVMALCPQHTFQLLSKRPERMAAYLGAVVRPRTKDGDPQAQFTSEYMASREYRVGCQLPFDLAAGEGFAERLHADERSGDLAATAILYNSRAFRAWNSKRLGMIHDWYRRGQPWPLPNVWCGTSVEDQATADERIPHLLRCPAAVRFLSVEPMLAHVDIFGPDPNCDVCDGAGEWEDGENPRQKIDGCWCTCDCVDRFEGVGWVIIGAESGPNRRPCDIAWVRSLIEQCAVAGVPCFVKQLPRPDGTISHDSDDPQWPWPAWAQVRQFPETT